MRILEIEKLVPAPSGVDFFPIEDIQFLKDKKLFGTSLWIDQAEDVLYWQLHYDAGVGLTDLNAAVSTAFPFVLAFNRVWSYYNTVSMTVAITDNFEYIAYGTLRYKPIDLSTL